MSTTFGLNRYGKESVLAARMIEVADQGGRVVVLARDATAAARFMHKFKLDLWPEISVVLVGD
jgi:hypothetical protein